MKREYVSNDLLGNSTTVSEVVDCAVFFALQLLPFFYLADYDQSQGENKKETTVIHAPTLYNWLCFL